MKAAISSTMAHANIVQVRSSFNVMQLVWSSGSGVGRAVPVLPRGF